MGEIDVLHVALGLIATFGGLWVRSLQAEIKRLSIALDEVSKTYQRRDETIVMMQSIKDMTVDIRNRIDRIDEKLDRKADKQR